MTVGHARVAARACQERDQAALFFFWVRFNGKAGLS
jgi:hypothetical protein